DLLVNLRQRSLQSFNAILGRANSDFCSIKLGIGGVSHREPFSRSAFLSKRRFSSAQTIGQLLTRCLLILQRTFETLDQTECAPEKKMPWRSPRDRKIIARANPIRLQNSKTSAGCHAHKTCRGIHLPAGCRAAGPERTRRDRLPPRNPRAMALLT